jgi:predicted nucleotidyltransferase
MLSYASSALVTVIAEPFPPAVGPAVVLLVAVGLGLSTWNSVTRDRRQRRESMLAAVSEEAQTLERVHGEVARRRAAAAEFLHGPIQSQLVASALKGETNEQALEAIEKRFAEYNASTTRWDVQEQVAALADAWSDVMAIRVSCAPEMWQRLQRGQLTARLLVDSLSEAVTNAVRHGEVADIDVTIDDTDNRVRLTVSSLGTLTNGIGNGSGLARLVDRGALITLDQVNERVVMHALL